MKQIPGLSNDKFPISCVSATAKITIGMYIHTIYA